MGALPSYLSPPVAVDDYYYGDLFYEEQTDSWIIRGEPVVVQMAKKLFPGSSGRGKGMARYELDLPLSLHLQDVLLDVSLL